MRFAQWGVMGHHALSKSTFFFFFALILADAGCGGEGGLGLEPEMKLHALHGDDRKAACDYMAAAMRGEGLCHGNYITFEFEDKECPPFDGCSATVAQFETCMDAVALDKCAVREGLAHKSACKEMIAQGACKKTFTFRSTLRRENVLR